MISASRFGFLLLGGLLLPALALADVPVPPLKARVTDLTGTLSAPQQQELERVLADFERRKGGQVAVLMVPTTKPETIEQYAVRVEEAWKLGRKGVDDSVLLVVAKNDRRLRIEVGYGYEGALPDARAKRIIDDVIVPRFKQGDFNGGIRAGVDRILGAVQGEALPAPAAQPQPPRHERPDYLPPVNFDIFFFLVIVAFIAHAILQSIFGRFVGAGLLGAAGGSLVWLYVGTLFLSVFVGLAIFALSLLFKPMARGSGSGWSSGSDWSSGGGSWSSSSSDSGGFSGGGGSSGGGGASGSW